MSNFAFLDYIHEGKMIRNTDGVSRMSFTDASDLVLLYLLALHVMRHYNVSRKFASNYAKETLKWGNWDKFRSSGNDLYGLLNIVDGEEEIVQKLRSPRNAMALRERTHVPTLAIKRFLRGIANNTKPSLDDSSDLMKIERALPTGMQSYSILRRQIANYARLSYQETKEAVSKLELALKARGRMSDIVDYYAMFVQSMDLETPVKDTEPGVSIADPSEPDTKHIALLRMLGVPSNDLPFAYKAYSIVSRGQALPPRFSQAYKPIMQIIDDILSAGPGYVNLLKQVHARAKSTKK